MRRITLSALLVVGCGQTSAELAPSSPPNTATAAAHPTAASPAVAEAQDPEAVVRAYLDATARSDLDAAAALVLADDSLVFESGGPQGSWSQYREHHLGPEVAMFKRFDLAPGEVRTWTSGDGSLALVVLPMTYDIELEDGRKISSLGTVTFGLTRQPTGGYRIVHMHWSSRPKPPPGKQGHGHGH